MGVRFRTAILACVFSAGAWGQAQFPSKPITMVVGFEPGGGTDTVARIIAKFLGDNLGQQVLVENRAGAGHLAGELLQEVAHIKLVHVPYKGGGPAMRGLLGGEIDSYFATPVAALPHIRSGRAIAIASTGPKRDKALPDVPTVAESGYP